MKSVVLNQFNVIFPKNCVKQQDLLEWIIQFHQAAEKNNKSSAVSLELIEKLFNKYAVKSAQIAQRYLEYDDVFSTNFNANKIYRIDEKSKNGVDIGRRSEFFAEKAFDIFNRIYSGEILHKKPDHLIHVTCTGYISPSAAQRLVADVNWGQSTDVTHAYHMGCYAALPAVRLAKSLVKTESTENKPYQVDVVHTEMCGLHLDSLSHTPEQMIVQTLFADGHIKYTLTNQKNESGGNLKILTTLEKVIQNSQHDMTWTPSSWGLAMTLSRDVPSKIKSELKVFTDELFTRAELSSAEGLKGLFAIHPGGPKIIDSVQEVLELSEQQIAESRNVLQYRGNMSSATLPHVWNEILNKHYPLGTKVISLAFGPGLTIFGAVFEVC